MLRCDNIDRLAGIPTIQVNVIPRLRELFSGFPSAYGIDLDGKPRTIRATVSDEVFSRHLSGECPIGLIPLNEQNESRWGCIDYRVPDDDLHAIVRKIYNVRSRLPLVATRSEFGLRLWLFLRLSHPAAAVIATLQEMAAHLGISHARTRYYPQQASVQWDRGDVGSWVRLPYGGGSDPALAPDGHEMPLGSFLATAEGVWLDRLPDSFAPTKSIGSPQVGPDAAFSDGPPCLQHITARDIFDHARAPVLSHMATYFKRADPAWQVSIAQAAHRFMAPPLPAEEVLGIVRAHERRDIDYACTVQPMRAHCDIAVCRFRRYGIGQTGEYPYISGLTMVDGKPPGWFVDVGPHRLEISTDDLRNYDRFHRRCVERLKICFVPVKQPEWALILQGAMELMVTVDPIPKITDKTKFVEFLADFCSGENTKISKREDILRGVPWYDPDRKRYWFRMEDFKSYLEQRHVDLRDYGLKFWTDLIRGNGGAQQQLVILPPREENRSCWWIPAKFLNTK